MKLLVVGAGAVGLVYGAHAAEGGAEVALYVRERRRAEAEAGYALTRVRPLRARTTRRFVPARVVTTEEEVRALDADQLWIATATDALFEPWLDAIVAASPRALVVFFQPGADAADRMRALVPDDARRVRGAISMVSWHAPLEGSADPRERTTPPGYAYLLPLAPSGFEGAHARAIVDTLRRGHCPARIAKVTESLATGSAILLPHVATLEAAAWSLTSLASREHASLAAAASREAIMIVSRRAGTKPPMVRAFVSALLTRMLVTLARLAAPLDLETYLRVHFTKVRAQTLLILDEYVRDATRLSLPSSAMTTLRAKLG
jgi:2-dehydropantoate 2-reductase